MQGAARTNIAQVDSATGLVTTWNPGCNGYVFTITQNGDNVYIGGNYNQLAGVARTSLGAVNANTGAVTNFDPAIQLNGSQGTVNALAFDASNILYVGGYFNSVKGTTRNNLAALNTSGALQTWNPNANSTVNAIAVNNASASVLVGGNFTSLNGSTTRNYFAEVNNTNGNVTSFNPNMNGGVNTLWISGNNVYVGGCFYYVAGTYQGFISHHTI